MRSLDMIGGRRSLIAPVLAGAFALVVAACGGAATPPPAADGGADQERIEAAIDDLVAAGGIDISGADDADEAEVEAPAIEPVSMPLGQEAWFAGFKITFNQLDLVPDGRRGDLNIAASFENLGDDPSRMDATITLMSGGRPVPESFDMDIPTVPAGTTVDGMFGFRVDGEFSLDDAVLTLGTPAVQQVVLPLSSPDEIVSLEPAVLSLSGTGTAGQLEVTVDRGELRADRPESHGQMKSGKLALTVTYGATNHGTGAPDFAFTGDNIRLRLPDGSVVADMGDGYSQSIELLKSGTSKQDMLTRFEVEEPASGEYALQVLDGDEVAEIPFTLP